MNDMQERLDQLSDWTAKRDVLNMAKQDMIDEILTNEIREQLASIEAEFSPKFNALEENIAELTEQIKRDVLINGATVKGTYLMAVYNKGRVSWDSKQLEGMMAIIPGLVNARKEGEPSITLRKI